VVTTHKEQFRLWNANGPFMCVPKLNKANYALHRTGSPAGPSLTAPYHRGGPVRPCAATHPGGPHSDHPNSGGGTLSERAGHHGQ